ncbi:Putative cyclase [Noviherbaspirillum humi]|uniref:Putative cyclase n=1 Tax=Noviherbaspirillum humi TaxID=1688639 RepID=A0A239EW72_9BURK|nr:cyclase family protein [Noviherbaspirillum humi]SNS49010.1 Putative cyclase [Noviherbaspirillum humi]
MTSKRWVRRPPGSNWGDFGPDDQLGRLNLIGPAQRLAAMREVTEGITFSLSLPLDVPRQPALNPRRQPPRLQPAMHHGAPYFSYALGQIVPGATDVVSDDSVTLFPQYSTQWDALAHVCQQFDADGDGVAEAVGYNGFSVAGDAPQTLADYRGAQALSVASAAAHGVQGRGVLIDAHRRFGQVRHAVGYDDLMRLLEDDGVEIRSGDILCLHTGFARLAASLATTDDHALLRTSCAVLDGTDARLLQWITDSGIAAIAADNYAVEERRQALPPGAQGALLPLHEHCLFKLGLPLGEMWHLSELAEWLARHGRHAFLLTAPPLHLPGAVGSPANPIATV